MGGRAFVDTLSPSALRAYTPLSRRCPDASTVPTHPRTPEPMHPRAQKLIRELELQPHPEGGFFREVYRSSSAVRPADARGERPALTTIYFLLAAGQHSRWHRVTSCEAWHFYEGDALELLWLDRDGATVHRERLEPVSADAAPVQVVPAGCWQAARSTGEFTLVGCTVGPGFDFADFAMLADVADEAEAERLRRDPELAALI